MSELTKVLVVEDELTNSILLKRLLIKAGYSVVTANNGFEALKYLEKESFEAVLTDWMMPQMDGIELIRKIREVVKPLPYVIMITALVSEGAKTYALESGSDDYIAKPIDVNELLTRLHDGLAKKNQQANAEKRAERKNPALVKPPFPVVVIATSTGGPPTLIDIFKSIPNDFNAPIMIVQHGPPWMLETFAQRLQKETKLEVKLAMNGESIKPGKVYIAPGDLHMRIDAKSLKIKLDDSPKENFVRPAADPLFRSATDAFGKYTLGVILTGLGRDGVAGAAQIVDSQGEILVQSPETAVAPSMPNALIASRIQATVITLDNMGNTISQKIASLNKELNR